MFLRRPHQLVAQPFKRVPVVRPVAPIWVDESVAITRIASLTYWYPNLKLRQAILLVVRDPRFCRNADTAVVTQRLVSLAEHKRAVFERQDEWAGLFRPSDRYSVER